LIHSLWRGALAKTSIVRELQRDAIDRNVPVSDLLRKALLVATKLGVRDLEAWINHELNGYTGGTEVPRYRQLRGELKGFNPVLHSWTPILSSDAKSAEILETLSENLCGLRAAELEHLLSDTKSAEGSLQVTLPPQVQTTLQPAMKYPTQIALFISPSSAAGILDEIRNVTLKWAMKLEQDGILGEDLSFTTRERETASRMITNINNFSGPVHHSQIQQGSEYSPQTLVVEGLKLQELRALIADISVGLDSLPLSPESKAELRAELVTLQMQVDSPKPKHLIMREGLKSVRHILEGAAGKLAVDWVPRVVGFLSQLGGPTG